MTSMDIHLQRFRLIQETSIVHDKKQWTSYSHRGEGVPEGDSSIWMYIAIQLCIEGQVMPSWDSDMGNMGRIYLASCPDHGQINSS